eukprot:scaffold855_cov344-Prasinococcus_capsulatus_cf.AAC.2
MPPNELQRVLNEHHGQMTNLNLFDVRKTVQDIDQWCAPRLPRPSCRCRVLAQTWSSSSWSSLLLLLLLLLLLRLPSQVHGARAVRAGASRRGHGGGVRGGHAVGGGGGGHRAQRARQVPRSRDGQPRARPHQAARHPAQRPHASGQGVLPRHRCVRHCEREQRGAASALRACWAVCVMAGSFSGLQGSAT